MALRLNCPICNQKLTINLPAGMVYCQHCGYQPLREWREMAPETQRIQLHPLAVKGQARAQVDLIECPNCGGDDLQPIAGKDVVWCPACHTQYSIQTQAPIRPKTLRGVHLHRKHQPLRWETTERLLKCPSCGSEITTHPEALTSRCPFCDSTHVLVRDSLNTLEAPAAILPFAISAKAVEDLVEQKVNQGLHGLTRWLRERVVKMSGKPLYLPWWLIEVVVDVYWRYDVGMGTNGIDTHTVDFPPVYAALANRAEAPKLLPYDLSDLKPYEPAALATIQAEIPQLDITQVMPPLLQEAKRKTSYRVRVKRPDTLTRQTTIGRNVQTRIRIEPHARQVNYRLVLLPVWVVLLHEADGDTRRALVNGQTGEVQLEGSPLWGILTDSGKND